MAEFQRPTPPSRTQSAIPARPKTLEIVTHGVFAWRRQHRCALPPPCPPEPVDCARWWLDKMAEPETRGETRFASVVGRAASVRWVAEYATHARDTLVRFLSLNDAERRFIIAAREDDIFWRGDDLRLFRTVVDETLMARDRPKSDYRKIAIQAMSRQLSRIRVNGDGS